MVQREQRRQYRGIICEVFLETRIRLCSRTVVSSPARTCTSRTTSYSSTSASRSIAVLLRMLLKSAGAGVVQEFSAAVRGEGRYH